MQLLVILTKYRDYCIQIVTDMHKETSDVKSQLGNCRKEFQAKCNHLGIFHTNLRNNSTHDNV